MDVEHRLDNLYMTYNYFSSVLHKDVSVHIFNDLFLLLYGGMLEHLKVYVLDSHQKYSDYGFVWVEKLNVCDIPALLGYISQVLNYV